MSLRELIEAVEAGTLCQGDVISLEEGDLIATAFQMINDVDAWEYVSMAMDGSLDAAKALHDAVLPGCYVQITTWPMPPMTRVDIGGGHVGRDGNSARAWLIAILRAMEARDVKGDG